MPALRILVADDHEIVRRGICALLKSHAGWDVCTEAADGREAVESAKQLDPDIVILDIGMPNVNGLTAARQILQNDPQQKILFLTITDSEQIVREVLQTGARGFVLKSDAARDLLTAVEALEKNRTFFTRRVSEMILEGYLNGEAQKDLTEPSVSPREREIVQLLAEGKSTKEVAFILELSIKTVETHRSNVMRKLGIHSVMSWSSMPFAITSSKSSLGQNDIVSKLLTAASSWVECYARRMGRFPTPHPGSKRFVPC